MIYADRIGVALKKHLALCSCRGKGGGKERARKGDKETGGRTQQVRRNETEGVV